MVDVLAAAWHPGSANAIAPVVSELEEEVEIAAIAQEYAQDVFDEYGVSYETPESYGIQDVSTDSMADIIGDESPELVLTGTSAQSESQRYAVEQTATEAANYFGVSTLGVLDFWSNYKNRFCDQFDENDDFKYLPDKVAVMDELAKQGMIEAGVDGERLTITGNPYFDELSDLEEEFSENDLSRIREDLGFETGSYMAMFASQPLIEDEIEIGYTQINALEELLTAAEEHTEEPSLLIKSHPREDIEKLKQIAQGYEVNARFEDEYNIRDLILASDSVFSMFSTVLVEASYLGRPAISLQPGISGEDPLITNELGVTLPVYGKGETEEVLQGLLNSDDYFQERAPNQRKFTTDGQAKDRVLDLVREDLDNS